MELYVNSDWTERYANAYIAEAIAWSENGNHATIYALGLTPEEADAKLMGALRELKLIPEACMKDEQYSTGPE
jgi:2'-5' RNA ligase